MRAVLPLHSSLGLRRTGRDHLDPQLPAHPPKLRHRLCSSQLLLHRGHSFVQILPIHVHRQWHAVPFDPGAQRIDHRPDRLLLAQLRPRRAGGVIHQVDQAAPRSPLFQPGVETAIHLHHLSKMLFALAPPKVPPPFPLATPQAFRQHPPPQRFGMHLQPVLGFQVLGRQRRTKALPYRSSVLVPHSPQHLLSKLLVVGAIRAAPRAAVLQSCRPFLPIPLPQPLRLSVAHFHQAGGIHHLQLSAFHACQHFHSTQFLLTHPDSPHPASFRGRSLGDISIEEKRGHYHRGSTLPPSIFDLHRAVLPLTYHHLLLRRSVLPTLRLHLKQPIVVAHHPVVPDDPLALQTEDLPQLRR